MAACGRCCRSAVQLERQLSEPLPTKPLEAAKRRYVLIADIRCFRSVSRRARYLFFYMLEKLKVDNSPVRH